MHDQKLYEDLEGAVEGLEDEEVEEARLGGEAELEEHVVVAKAESKETEHEDDLHGGSHNIPNHMVVGHMAQLMVNHS